MKVDNAQGITNLCAVAAHLLQTMPVNAATKFAVRTVIREAINKSCPGYRGNANKNNVQYMSVAAEAALANGEAGLVADHAVPVSMALQTIYEEKLHSVEDIEALVAGFSTMVLVTSEENRRLTEAGLVKKMPPGWDGSDRLARYRQLGIEIAAKKPPGGAGRTARGAQGDPDAGDDEASADA